MAHSSSRSPPDEARAGRTALLTRNPALAITCRLVRSFADIMVGRRCHKVQKWITYRRDGSPALRSLAVGLLRDLDAVTAGVTLEYSPGPVEGHVNRIKMLERQMYGRAHFDLLRKRVIHMYEQVHHTNHEKCDRSRLACPLSTGFFQEDYRHAPPAG
ncbi:transposase [Rhodococcus pyridinivorans]|uniref:transposase n=1 Tax=Rhodococcus pyridinivorans TaxID=103816 RepID=UPI002078D9F2|nr:transposase [Rhodococcus pyridinivorans]USI92952.1 transposase [Rhodococcus pyridinivorans]